MSHHIEIIKDGIFKEEIKNRFRAIVKIDGMDELCYVQSSSRMSNYVDLRNKRVWLVKNHLCNKMKYTLFSISYKRNMIFLIPSLANDVILSEINDRRLSFLGERKEVLKEISIDNYKCDLYIPKTKTIIEIKSFISKNDRNSIFPVVYSERTIKQLEKMKELLFKGYHCVFMLVSLNPYVEHIMIDKNTIFYTKIKELVNAGLTIRGVAICYKNTSVIIKKSLDIFL